MDRSQITLVWVPVPLTIMSNKSLNISALQFLHQQNEGDYLHLIYPISLFK